MLSKDKMIEITTKLSEDEEAKAMIIANDIQGLIAKCESVGFEVTEGDVEEFIVDSIGEVDVEELNSVSGGCGKKPWEPGYRRHCNAAGCEDDHYGKDWPMPS